MGRHAADLSHHSSDSECPGWMLRAHSVSVVDIGLFPVQHYWVYSLTWICITKLKELAEPGENVCTMQADNWNTEFSILAPRSVEGTRNKQQLLSLTLIPHKRLGKMSSLTAYFLCQQKKILLVNVEFRRENILENRSCIHQVRVWQLTCL